MTSASESISNLSGSGLSCRRRILGAICAALLLGILVAGLWPFQRPRNAVSWLAGRNGLHIVRHGTAWTSREFQFPAGAASLELWLQPEAPGSKTIVALYSQEADAQLLIRQTYADLTLRDDAFHRLNPSQQLNPSHQLNHGSPSADRKNVRLVADNIFIPGKARFLTIISDGRGTAVYAEGQLIKEAEGVPSLFTGPPARLIVSNSGDEHDSWQGEMRGLAIYGTRLDPGQIRRHYLTWTNQGRPAVTEEERCAALYLFDERRGPVARDSSGAHADLSIPERFQLVRPIFLQSIPRGYDFEWWYLQDALVNILGFVPLGFFLCAYLSCFTGSRAAALITLASGVALTFTIEILQSHLPTRDSSLTDVVNNILGAGAGAALCRSKPGQAVLRVL